MRRPLDPHRFESMSDSERLSRTRFPSTLPDLDHVTLFVRRQGCDAYAPEAPFIDRTTPVVTIGSCFSGHIARTLSEAGLAVTNYDMSERIFTTFALKDFFEGVRAGHVPEALIDDVESNRARVETIRAALSEGATIILTLGLSFCWFEIETGRLVHSIVPGTREKYDALGGKAGMKALFSRFEMRPTSVADNAENLRHAIACIKAMNPANRIVFTVSPVPLQNCVAQQPMLTADYMSKSVLRLAIAEIEESVPEGVYYFPSFEIVRWAMPFVSQAVWGSAKTDGDLRHVDPDVVTYVCSLFLFYYANGI